jgi:hypothetical protein
MQTLAILLLLVLAAPFQRIETQHADRGKVMRLETAMNHLTVIELNEPVILAAAGSPLFKIERRDNKVFIQPLEEGASTNLFVWTESGRWNYELIPAASLETMHFAIDQHITLASSGQNGVIPKSAASDSGVAASFAEDMLLFAKPIRTVGLKFATGQVGVFITDVYRKDEQLFLRYFIDNRTTRPYVSGSPEVFKLESAYSRTSLHTFRYSQVGPDIERNIRSRSLLRIATIDCELPTDPLPPAETATGILTLSLPLTSSEPAVLKFLFPTEGREPISVTVIL